MRLAELDPFLRFASPLRFPRKAGAAQVVDCRLFYITEGTALLRTGEAAYDLTPGSLFYCCAGSRYAIESDPVFSLLVLDFDLDCTHADQVLPIPPCREPEKWPGMPVYSTSVEDSPFLNGHLFLPDAAEFRLQVEAIITEFSSVDGLGKAVGASLLKTLLLRLHRATVQRLPPKLAMIRQYMAEHFAEPVTNRDLAALAGYHEYYLNRIFRAHMGVSLHEYLLQLRLQQARSLLLDPAIPLETVAERCGFGSYPHFSGYFRQMCGCSPGKYRQLHRGSI